MLRALLVDARRRATTLLTLAGALAVGCAGAEATCEEWGCEIWVCGAPRPACPCGSECERAEAVEGGGWVMDPDDGSCVALCAGCEVPAGWESFGSLVECEGPACSSEPVWIWDPEREACISLESDCEVPSGWEFFVSELDCERAGARCGSGRACPSGLVCDLPSCDAVVGRCVSAPTSCMAPEQVGSPATVCGCDGTSYPDDCARLLSGAALDHPGPC